MILLINISTGYIALINISTGYLIALLRSYNIGTGYLNRPNWLLAGDSVYHRVASQPTMLMTGISRFGQAMVKYSATGYAYENF